MDLIVYCKYYIKMKTVSRLMKNKSIITDNKEYAKLVKEVGYPTKSKIRIDVDFARAMFDTGWSYRQIGRHFGVSGITVKRRLREANLV